MKRFIPALFMNICLVCLSLWFAGCSKMEGPQYTNDQANYTLNPVVDDRIQGTVTFTRRTDNAVIITIQLTGTAAGSSHPAFLHSNTAAEGGPVVLDLEDIDGVTGKSETVVTAFNDNSPLTYEGIISFSGYIDVHVSSGNLETIIALGDVGQNAVK